MFTFIVYINFSGHFHLLNHYLRHNRIFLNTGLHDIKLEIICGCIPALSTEDKFSLVVVMPPLCAPQTDGESDCSVAVGES